MCTAVCRIVNQRGYEGKTAFFHQDSDTPVSAAHNSKRKYHQERAPTSSPMSYPPVRHTAGTVLIPFRCDTDSALCTPSVIPLPASCSQPAVSANRLSKYRRRPSLMVLLQHHDTTAAGIAGASPVVPGSTPANWRTRSEVARTGRQTKSGEDRKTE